MPENIPIGRALSKRYEGHSKLDAEMVPRTANRAKERLMAYLNKDGYFVSATVLVGSDGKMIDPTVVPGKLDLVIEELRRLNTHLTLLTGNEV